MTEKDEDKQYRFHWLDGSTNEGPGRNRADAFTRLGFGGGAIAALDYYEEIKCTESSEVRT